MKKIFLLWFGVSCFSLTGNAQNSAASGTASGLTTSYGIQGNRVHNQTLLENDIKRAAEEARQMKALKDSMRVVNPAAQKYRTAEEYLAANRPPMPPAVAPEELARIRRDSHVPEFDTGNSGAPASAQAPPPVYVAPPQEKRNFFRWLNENSKKNGGGYVPPARSATPGNGGEATEGFVVSEPGDGAVEYVNMDLPEKGNSEGGLLGRWFKGNKKTAGEASELMPAPASSETVDSTIVDENSVMPSQEPANEGALPEPPNWAESTPPPAQETDAPIFVKRSEMESGQTATVKANTQAQIEGVRVMLYEGTQVNLLSKSGNEASIQLRDGRKGTAELNALQL